jgi:hypothetical protein
MRFVCGGNLPTRRTSLLTFGPPKVRQHCCPNLDAKILTGIQGAAQQISSLQLIFVFAGAGHIGFAAALAKPTKNPGNTAHGICKRQRRRSGACRFRRFNPRQHGICYCIWRRRLDETRRASVLGIVRTRGRGISGHHRHGGQCIGSCASVTAMGGRAMPHRGSCHCPRMRRAGILRRRIAAAWDRGRRRQAATRRRRGGARPALRPSPAPNCARCAVAHAGERMRHRVQD